MCENFGKFELFLEVNCQKHIMTKNEKKYKIVYKAKLF